jgi:hypothetical protein
MEEGEEFSPSRQNPTLKQPTKKNEGKKTLKYSKTPEFRRIKVPGILWLWNPGSLKKKKHNLSLSHTHARARAHAHTQHPLRKEVRKQALEQTSLEP